MSRAQFSLEFEFFFFEMLVTMSSITINNNWNYQKITKTANLKVNDPLNLSLLLLKKLTELYLSHHSNQWGCVIRLNGDVTEGVTNMEAHSIARVYDFVAYWWTTNIHLHIKHPLPTGEKLSVRSHNHPATTGTECWCGPNTCAYEQHARNEIRQSRRRR